MGLYAGSRPARGLHPLTSFSRDTARDLRTALRKLNKTKLRGLILDLRFNPGGLLNSAIEVCGMFISEGRIVSTAGRNSPERAWDAHPGEVFENFPMVILVNRYSASASEIVSACLQDHKRALVVGERTWGKGSVQNVIELEGGNSLLKLTTAAYKRPSGKNIHRFPNAKDSDEWGVMPDKGYDLKLSEKDMFRLMLDRRDRDVLQPHTAKSDDDAHLVAKAGPTPAATPADTKEESASSKTDPAAAKKTPPPGRRREGTRRQRGQTAAGRRHRQVGQETGRRRGQVRRPATPVGHRLPQRRAGEEVEVRLNAECQAEPAFGGQRVFLATDGTRISKNGSAGHPCASVAKPKSFLVRPSAAPSLSAVVF